MERGRWSLRPNSCRSCWPSAFADVQTERIEGPHFRGLRVCEVHLCCKLLAQPIMQQDRQGNVLRAGKMA
eukprot:418389-Amphidinium_carterae.3